ncbi:3-phosphoshikimate 1-carboxyvinyltransferase [Catellatospora methionotrophica]|uniref:3-phosphoshikimate 1-carboxyvinyltransferase n=1 Tax=Catellatospora methionotrophica TaxID=121620 RepID=A0A8J3LPU7_9ACTN|nr:3-phosphoshikimate 1-carboxyvinyltransferase [Catellatospora methionotrophica]GIG16695.1 3-phosphoshikimate 1-carboxyvinyltransferase [Catellatospora methionotrophica]
MGADSLLAEIFGPARENPDRIRVRATAAPIAEGAGLMLRAHPDKAISQRATLLSAIANGTSTLRNLADCDDVRSNLTALGALGVPLSAEGPGSVRIVGRQVRDIRLRDRTLDVGNSATTSRLLLAVLAGSGSDCTVTGNRLLRSRPMSEVIQPLLELGADLVELGEPGRLPVRVRGTRLHGGPVTVDVDSAQPVSALLFAATHATGTVRIHRRTVARDHTERLLRWTGVPVDETPDVLMVTPHRPAAFDLTVPGDPSGAALLAALHLASAHRHRELTIPQVCLNPLRTGFFRILESMGAAVTESPRAAHRTADPEPVGDLRVRCDRRLRGTRVAGPRLVQSAIDELPMVAALASVADGETVITDAGELRGKDTDRIKTTLDLLTAFGVDAQPTPEGLVVRPGGPVVPARVDLPADHRILFAAFVLAVLSGGECELAGTRSVATSHPGALDDLRYFAEVVAR